ncbi:MAG: 50S ribosomal protein L11 methyltransferase [Chloroflexi bacterium]|nr:50S ribosomal protein L11 methyltransferase [Chloroflexota bacterium]
MTDTAAHGADPDKPSSKRWIEVALTVDGEAAEATADVLQRYGYQGVAIEFEGIPAERLDDDELPPPTHMTVRAYIRDDERAPETKAQLEAALGHMSLMYPMPTPVYRTVDEEDWAEAWKQHYKPLRIGVRLLIRPVWVEIARRPDEIEIALDPGMAFGTGTHPTTQLCLEALDAHIQPGAQVFDLGTGSGILAIAAAKLGAAHVLAVDNDPVAVEAALENVAQNDSIDKITVQAGSLASVVGSARRFDVLVANILARVIIAMCEERLGEVIRPGGLGLFSGIMVTQADDVEAALRATGLEPFHRRVQGDWVVIEARRPAAA